MYEISLIKRQRRSALWNGVVLGMGLGWIIYNGHVLGILALVLGIILEILTRRQMKAEIHELGLIKSQRWCGLWNGVVIGMGVGWLLFMQIMGVIPVVLGIIIERRQLRVLDRDYRDYTDY